MFFVLFCFPCWICWTYLQDWESSSLELGDQPWHICSGFLDIDVEKSSRRRQLETFKPSSQFLSKQFLLSTARVMADQGSSPFQLRLLAVSLMIHCFHISSRSAIWVTQLLDLGLATKCLSFSLRGKCSFCLEKTYWIMVFTLSFSLIINPPSSSF